MKYDIDYACGHIVTTELYGKEEERARKIKWLENEGVCPECFKKQKAAERASLQAKAEANIKKYGYAELSGSFKQIAWAKAIREEVLSMVDKVLDDYELPKHVDMERLGNILRTEICENNRSASYWIDNRTESKVKLADLLVNEAVDTLGGASALFERCA